MRSLPIVANTTLTDLSTTLGRRNVTDVLVANGIERCVNVGQSIISKQNDISSDSSILISNQRKASILNKLRSDSDLFEKAALMSEAEWRVLDSTDAFYSTLTIPDTVSILDESTLLGNHRQMDSSIANAAIDQIMYSGQADPALFNQYNMIHPALRSMYPTYSGRSVFEGFKIPQREVVLYSSLADEFVDFPVYPETLSDKITANYDTMPDLLYQYEPWYTYKSTGPRQNTYVFEFHRDMWTGDHRDGKAFQLIQFCKANCYPRYRGSSVHTSYVTLYIGTHAEISGILTDVEDEWDGPLGLDHRQLHCKLSLSITEISEEPLDFDTVKNKKYTYLSLSEGVFA